MNKKRILFLSIASIIIIGIFGLINSSKLKAEETPIKNEDMVGQTKAIDNWEPVNTSTAVGFRVDNNNLLFGMLYGDMSDLRSKIPASPTLEMLKPNLYYGLLKYAGFQFVWVPGYAGDGTTSVQGGIGTAGPPVTTAPLIFGQGDKVVEALNRFGHGDINNSQPPSIASDVRFSKYGTLPNYPASWAKATKLEYILRNNPAVSTPNTFPYNVKVEFTSVVDAGRIVSSLKVTNMSTTPLDDFVLGSRYDVDLIGGLHKAGGKTPSDQIMPVKYLGYNRGVQYSDSDYRIPTDSNWSLNFYMEGRDRPNNWMIKQLPPEGDVSSFYNPAYSGFDGPNATGAEKLNAPPGSIAYSKAMKDSSVSGVYDTAMYMKNKPVTLKKGESTGYSYSFTSISLTSPNPYLTLEEAEPSYSGGAHKVIGNVTDFSSTSKKIQLWYSFTGAADSYKTNPNAVIDPYVPGIDSPFSFDIPENELPKPIDGATIYVKAKNLSGGESEAQMQTLRYNGAPTISAKNQSNSWYMAGSPYEVKGSWKEPDGESVDIYYSLGDNSEVKLLRNQVNAGPNQSNQFSGEIPVAELGGKSHTLKVWAVDSRNGKSNVEEWAIGPHSKPIVAADLAIDKTQIDAGQTVAFTSMFTNAASAPSVWNNVQYETTNAFPKGVDVNTKSVTLTATTNGVTKNVTPKSITFGADRKLRIDIGAVSEKALMKMTYDVVSTDTPPVTTPITVDQSFTVSGTTADLSAVQASSNTKTFTITPRIANVEVLYLETSTETPLKEKITLPTGVIGQMTMEIPNDTKIEGYELTKVFFDSIEQTPLPDKPFKVEYGKVKQVKFYYEGRLRFKTVPSSFDFGIQTAGATEAKKFKPEIKGENLIISDTRRNQVGWSLKAKIIEEFKNVDGVTLPDVIKYNNGGDKPLDLNGQDLVIFEHKATEKHEYDVTKENWIKNDEGFLLDINAGALKGLGKYHAELELTLEDAK